MPFCSNCGRFSVALTQQKLCSACKKLEYEGEISEEQFRQQQSRLHDDVSMSLLHYKSGEDFKQAQSDQSQQSEEPYAHNHEPATFHQRPDEQEDSVANFALGLIAIGYLLLFLDFVVFGAIANVGGLIAAFIAKRREITQKWRPQVAIGIGIIFWAVFILYNVLKLAGF